MSRTNPADCAVEGTSGSGVVANLGSPASQLGSAGIRVEDGVQEWLGWLAAGGSAPGSLRVKKRYVLDLARVAALDAICARDIEEWLANPRWAPETRKSARSSVRSFFNWATRNGVRDDNPTENLLPVKVPQGKPKPTPEAILDRALSGAVPEVRLMILLGAYAGLRRSEIAKIRLDDFTPYGLRVQGKGGRTRVVPLHPRIVAELEVYDGAEGGWLFPSPVRKGDHVSGDYVSKWLKDALGGEYTAHTLRHRFGTAVYKGCKDIRAVQELLGHTKPETTARYVLVDHDELAAAVGAVA